MALAAPLLNSSGIYAIENTVNGKRYVGSALSFRRRWRLHRRMLEAGRAPRKFQNAWNKYGPDKFEFRVLLICSRADLLFFENRAIASCDAVAHGYNSRHQAESNLGIRFGPPSESTRAKISAAQKAQGRCSSERNEQKAESVAAQPIQKIPVRRQKYVPF